MGSDPLTVVSLFAGIEGFGLAFERTGMRVVASVEIDPACRKVISRHFPASRQFTDIREVTADDLRSAGFVPARGVFAAGFPCQDLSVAGRRAGLGGARSGLFWHIVRLAGELRPRWLVLENVDGLLSAVCGCPGDGTCLDNGRAVRCGVRVTRRGRREFAEWEPHTPPGGACRSPGCMGRHGGALGAILGALGGLGYGFAWRVLDAQFFGLAQRRERVFIVCCLGDRAAPVEVLLEPESGAGDPAAGGAARADPASAAGRGADGPGWSPTRPVAQALTGNYGKQPDDSDTSLGPTLVVNALTAEDSQQAYTVHSSNSNVKARHAYEADTARALDTTGGFMPNQGGTIVASTLQGGGRRGHRVDAEGAAGGHLVVRPLTTKDRNNPADQTLVTSHTITSREARSTADSDATSGLIMTVTGPVAHALTSEGADASEDGTGRGTPIVAVPLALRGREGGNMPELGEPGDPAFAVRASTGGSSHGMIQAATSVRRLTPLECERLQGFPDGWTAGQSDSARYRQLGNAVAVNVAQWIAREIVAADSGLPCA